MAYFEDKVEGREPAGAPNGSKENSASADLERRGASGRWEKLWAGKLVNEVAPVDVIVLNRGRGFVTFDNWHSMGYGPNVIAIYSPDGRLVSQLGLSELFPDWFVAALPHSVSSIHWRGEPRISDDGAELIVPVVQPTNDESLLGEGQKTDLAIRLVDGAAVGLDRPEWKRAFADAGATARKRCVSQRQQVKEWNSPIAAPTTSKEEDWHHYLRETQFRTKWSDEPLVAGTTVLRLPNTADFQASVKWLEEALTEKALIEHDLRAIGSPDIDRLTLEIERIGKGIRAGQLTDVDLVIVSDSAHAERIRAALVRSGVTLTIIDPGHSIPQVPQRIQNESEIGVCQAPAKDAELTR